MGKAKDYPSGLWAPTIHLSLPPVLPSSLRAALLFSVWEVRLWQVVSQHAVVSTGSPVPKTPYGCQTLLAVQMKGFKLAW